MKNRPPAAFANQAKDVYGSQKKSTRTTVTAVLTILMTAFVVISLIKANWLTLFIFGSVLVGLAISLIVGCRADKYASPVKPEDSPDAIFKEHEE